MTAETAASPCGLVEVTFSTGPLYMQTSGDFGTFALPVTKPEIRPELQEPEGNSGRLSEIDLK